MLIGFSGFQRSGKTTASLFLQSKGYTILSVATPVKRFAKALGWNGIKDDKGRKILQLLGTDIGRNLIDINIWVNHLDKQINKLNAKEIYDIVIDDIRFPNEAEYIIKNGGLVFNIIRPNHGSDGHLSEQPLPSGLIFYNINNDGTIEDFKNKIYEVT